MIFLWQVRLMNKFKTDDNIILFKKEHAQKTYIMQDFY